MSNSRTAFACFVPVDDKVLQINNDPLREENRLLKKQVDVLTEQVDILKQISSVQKSQLDAIDAAMAER